MKTSSVKYAFISLFCLLLISHKSAASTLNNEIFGENSRWAIDASMRITRNLDKNANAFIQVIGLDVHKVFSHKTNDIGTLMFQPYIVKLNNVKKAPFTFDDGDDTQLTWRMVNFNYTGSAREI